MMVMSFTYINAQKNERATTRNRYLAQNMYRLYIYYNAWHKSYNEYKTDIWHEPCNEYKTDIWHETCNEYKTDTSHKTWNESISILKHDTTQMMSTTQYILHNTYIYNLFSILLLPHLYLC